MLQPPGPEEKFLEEQFSVFIYFGKFPPWLFCHFYLPIRWFGVTGLPQKLEGFCLFNVPGKGTDSCPGAPRAMEGRINVDTGVFCSLSFKHDVFLGSCHFWRFIRWEIIQHSNSLWLGVGMGPSTLPTPGRSHGPEPLHCWAAPFCGGWRFSILAPEGSAVFSSPSRLRVPSSSPSLHGFINRALLGC